MTKPTKRRFPIIGSGFNVLADIYQQETNLVVWKRSLANSLQQEVSNLLSTYPKFQAAMTVTTESSYIALEETFGRLDLPQLRDNIAELVDMFSCLFELERVGLRLEALETAMCPRFHVDKVPCRLVTTYQGVATEWIAHENVNREKLGRGSNGAPDNESGLYKNNTDIQQLSYGDVALFKGENWEGNENAGIVHRSPQPQTGQKRLVLTLDFIH